MGVKADAPNSPVKRTSAYRSHRVTSIQLPQAITLPSATALNCWRAKNFHKGLASAESPKGPALASAACAPLGLQPLEVVTCTVCSDVKAAELTRAPSQSRWKDGVQTACGKILWPAAHKDKSR